MTPTTFRCAHDGPVATVTLDRPDRLNALTFEVYAELREYFGQLKTQPGIRAVVLTGAGRAFCSGGDVEAIIGPLLTRDREGLLAFTRMTCDVIRNIRAAPQPIIAAVNGVAAGAGAVLALACDFRLGCEHSTFAFLFTKVGLSGADMGAAFLLPRVVGLARATELLMLGDRVEAASAEQMGLINRLVPSAELPTEAARLADRLARGPAAALAKTKELINRELALDLDTALALEAEAQAKCMEAATFKEGYEAFRDKRPPRFG